MKIIKIGNTHNIGSRRRCMEEHPLQVRHKHDWGREFILFLPQAAVLPGPDANIEFCHSKSSNLVLHVVFDVSDTLLGRGLRFIQGRCIRNTVKEQDSICAWTNRIAQHQFAEG